MPGLDLHAAAAGPAVTVADRQAAPAANLQATAPAADLQATAPAVPLLRLRYGGWPWAVAGGSVREVVGTERLQRNPRPAAGSPYGWLLGESEEIPVYLPAEPGPGDGARAVVVLQPAAGPACGLGVEAVDELRQAPISCLRHLPEQAASRQWAFPRLVLWDDGLALEIAPEAVPHLAAAGRPAEAEAEAGGAQRPAPAAPPAAGEQRFGAWLPGPSPSAALFAFTLPGAGAALDFALPAAQVVEALSAVMPRPVPGTPEPFLGLLAWRGEALPVLDLARALGLPSPGAGFAHAIVARAARSRQLLVFPVERMAGVRQGPFPQPALAVAPYPGACRVLGAFADGERMLVVPDLDGILERSPVAPGASGAASGWR
jgi:chemotaxis signal transduction protein